MALYYDLPVFKDVYKLILLIFEYTKDFPWKISFLKAKVDVYIYANLDATEPEPLYITL